MQEFVIYTQAKGRQSAPRKRATHYDRQEAVIAAGLEAIAGNQWVSIVIRETTEPSRWD